MRSIFLGWVPEPLGYGSGIQYCSHPKSPLKTADFSIFYPCIIADGKKKGKVRLCEAYFWDGYQSPQAMDLASSIAHIPKVR